MRLTKKERDALKLQRERLKAEARALKAEALALREEERLKKQESILKREQEKKLVLYGGSSLTPTNEILQAYIYMYNPSPRKSVYRHTQRKLVYT